MHSGARLLIAMLFNVSASKDADVQLIANKWVGIVFTDAKRPQQM